MMKIKPFQSNSREAKLNGAGAFYFGSWSLKLWIRSADLAAEDNIQEPSIDSFPLVIHPYNCPPPLLRRRHPLARLDQNHPCSQKSKSGKIGQFQYLRLTEKQIRASEILVDKNHQMELFITPSRVANIFLHHRPPNINANNNRNN